MSITWALYLTVLYNIALILQRLASQILRDEKSTLNDVLQAVHELGLSHKYFQVCTTIYHNYKSFKSCPNHLIRYNWKIILYFRTLIDFFKYS